MRLMGIGIHLEIAFFGGQAGATAAMSPWWDPMRGPIRLSETGWLGEQGNRSPGTDGGEVSLSVIDSRGKRT